MMDWEDQPVNEQTYAAMVAYFKAAYNKHARFGSAKSPRSQGYDSANRSDEQANNVTDQQKEELLQLMLQGKRLDTQASPANKNKFWATVRSQKPEIVPKS